jgi:type IV pilus assembly protein PilC
MSTTTGTRTFAYTGRDSAGKQVRGRLDAPHQGAVVSRLRSMGVAPLAIDEAKANAGLNREISLDFFGPKVKLKELTVMTRQMATMISAGLSLLRTLDILAEQTVSKPLKATLESVAEDIESGSSLSDALARRSEVFPPLMVSLVRAGETGGFLETALNSAAETYEKDVKLRATIKSAMAYPLVVLSMAVLAVFGMMIFIVPVFENMFASLHGTLPLPTEILVILSKQMVWLVPTLVVLVVAGVLWWRRHGNDERVRAVVDPLRLKLPVFGTLLKKIAIARFARNFGSMMGAGVPILRSLTVVGETSGNYVIEKALRSVQESVRTGKSVAEPLSKEPVFPSMVTQMIAVGEDAGALETMLVKIADFYDAEVESTTEALTSLIEPLLIAVIGVVIGGMIVALYMPIFNIYSLIK